jgi:hypothetical protein
VSSRSHDASAAPALTIVDRDDTPHRSAIVNEKFTDHLIVLVDVPIKQAHVAVLNASLEQVIRAGLIAQLSPKVLPPLWVYVVFGHTEGRDKYRLAMIAGIDVRIR